MLARRAGHQLLARGVECLNLDHLGLIHQHAIGNDLGFEAGGAKLLRDVFGGLVVFGLEAMCGSAVSVFRCSPASFAFGHGEKFLLDACLFAEVGVAEDLRSGWRGRCRTLRRAD